MIEKHFNLSCYAIEHPYKVEYSSQEQELVDLIDNNNDVYEFRLPDHEHYEVLRLLGRKLRGISRLSS
jgi:hypothetical protein